MRQWSILLSIFVPFITSKSVPEVSQLVVWQLGQNRKSLLPAVVFSFVFKFSLIKLLKSLKSLLNHTLLRRRPEAFLIVFAAEDQVPHAESRAGKRNCFMDQIKQHFNSLLSCRLSESCGCFFIPSHAAADETSLAFQTRAGKEKDAVTLLFTHP